MKTKRAKSKPAKKTRSKRPLKLFEIVMTAYKHFYVEARSEAEALDMEVLEDEASTTFRGDVQWEHEETSARSMDLKEKD